ncbi:protein lifeguard 1 [Lepeophtheirus salmonis]|uniref:protein lifeguard 1 n=1 Tax=Lepeophtheirus salmonis TaxID=72036 RepID=UPI001AEA7ADA|nr:protein lifeguard 1-like [Lepeophtheirus salmonis]
MPSIPVRNREPAVYYSSGPTSQGQTSQPRNYGPYYPPPNQYGQTYVYQYPPPPRYQGPQAFNSPQQYPPPQYQNYQQRSPRDNSSNEEGFVNFLENSDDAEGVRIQNADAFDDKKVRNAFTRKVFVILSIQLLFSCGVIALFTYIQPLRNFTYTYSYLAYFPLIFYLVLSCGLICSENLRRTFPCNLILLGLLTLCMSIFLGFLVAKVEPVAVLMAVGITTGITITLTIFAMQTKWDITGCGAYLLIFGVIALACGIAMIFLPRNKYVLIAYGAGTAILFSVYLVYDVQLMLGGNHKYSISPEDYIMAALSLYIDIVNIFTSILTIISAACE